MDVTCDRCKTRYEFDAALVSSRGTTVKCTSCEHQFRVFRPAGSGGLSGWTVRKADGSELRYLAMRELQSAISSAQVTEMDLLVPDDGSKPQRLGAIEELRSFFQAADPLEADTTRRQRIERAERQGRPVAPPVTPKIATTIITDDLDMLATNPALPRVAGSFQEAKSGATSLGFLAPLRPPPVKPPTQPSTPEPAPEAMFQGTNLEDDVNDALERVSLAIDESSPPRDSDHGKVGSGGPESSSPPESSVPPGQSIPPEKDGRRSSGPDGPGVRPSVLRRSSTADPRFSEYGRRASRPSFGRWTTGIVAVGIAGLLGVTALRKLGGEGKPVAASSVDNERVTLLMQEGDKLLLEGDIEGAKEQFAKASGAAELDARGARGLARVAILQADRVWLRSRLEGKDADDLAKTVERARAAVDAALKVNHDEALSAVLELDALRLQGKLGDARRHVSKIKGNDPGAGRALATLDLCEPEPSWDTVIERLRAAANTEKKLGQSQALLSYALARRGDVEAAKRELDKLTELAPEHPVLAALREYVGRAKPAAGASSAAPASSANAGDPLSALDFREALRRARAAQKRGNYDEAESMYEQALAKSPGNSEAQTGLAEVAHGRGDAAGAERRYRDMLKDNPHFVPGLVGIADLKWQRGDKGGAVELYRQVIQNAPGTAYADQAYLRIQEASGHGSGASGGASTSKPAGGKSPGKRGAKPEPKREPTPEPRPVSNPEIDTTDLPP